MWEAEAARDDAAEVAAAAEAAAATARAETGELRRLVEAKGVEAGTEEFAATTREKVKEARVARKERRRGPAPGAPRGADGSDYVGSVWLRRRLLPGELSLSSVVVSDHIRRCVGQLGQRGYAHKAAVELARLASIDVANKLQIIAAGGDNRLVDLFDGASPLADAAAKRKLYLDQSSGSTLAAVRDALLSLGVVPVGVTSQGSKKVHGHFSDQLSELRRGQFGGYDDRIYFSFSPEVSFELAVDGSRRGMNMRALAKKGRAGEKLPSQGPNIDKLVIVCDFQPNKDMRDRFPLHVSYLDRREQSS